MNNEIIINIVPFIMALASTIVWTIFLLKYTIHWLISIVISTTIFLMFYIIASIDVGLMVNKEWGYACVILTLYLVLTGVPVYISMYFGRDNKNTK